MGSRRGKKSNQTELNETDTELETDHDSILLSNSYQNSSKRRSKRINEKHKQQSPPRPTPANNVSLNISIQEMQRQYNLLREPIYEAFEYEIKEQDVYFMQDFYIELPKLKDIWKRIGFNRETQERRLEALYEKLIETFHAIIESEEDLECNIQNSIAEQRQRLNELCLELFMKPSELKMKQPKSILEEDEILSAQLKHLEEEKHKRLDEFNKLVIVENKYSKRLCIDPVEKRKTVPSQKMLNDLDGRIKELTRLCQERSQEMAQLKEEITQFSEDLDLSRSDSFAELIIMESIEDMPLGDEDLVRTREFRDELRVKDVKITDEIRLLRVKIRELWLKLNISNECINEEVMGNECEGTKRHLVGILREEYGMCVQVKMANMQKFIESVRVEIRDFMDKMLLGPKEVKNLEETLLGLTEYTEDLLTLHEKKREQLDFEYQESQAIYEIAAKWIKLWSEFIEFEEKTKDPARFKVRGHNMLIEEKQRKVFNSQLPRLENELMHLAVEFAEHGKEFTIHGLFWSEFIQRRKQDHEESKMNERKEKQIMRDNLKRNESRYGSKPITPLAIRNKRKLLATHHESVVSTPGRVKNSKLLKTDATPGTSVLGSSRMTSGKTTNLAAQKKPKLGLAAKRKSKTPAKNRFRKSRGTLHYDQSTINETIKDKTTGSMVSSSSYQTINSTAGSINSNNSRLTSNSASNSRIGRTTGATKPAAKPSKPPQSSSAKFAAASQRIDTLQVMHSTATNTFIEEENIDDIENVDSTVLSNKEAAKTKKTTSKICTASKFNFEHPDNPKYEKVSSHEVNYTEFSRDLVKMQVDLKANMSRNYASTLSDRSNLSTMSIRHTSLRSGKSQMSTLRPHQSEKEKLTSTLLSSN